MPKKMISRGVLSKMPGICYGDAEMEYNPVFTSIIDNFFVDGDRTLEDAIDHDMTEWDVPDNLLLWTICRATIVDSFVLRLFASDCIEQTVSTILEHEAPDISLLPIDDTLEEFVAEVIGCARSYATGECDVEMMKETQQEVVDLMVSPELPEHLGHFLNVCRHILDAHPDGGAIQCVMNLPRCYDQIGADSVALGAQMKAAFRSRCAEAGFFGEL